MSTVEGGQPWTYTHDSCPRWIRPHIKNQSPSFLNTQPITCHPVVAGKVSDKLGRIWIRGLRRDTIANGFCLFADVAAFHVCVARVLFFPDITARKRERGYQVVKALTFASLVAGVTISWSWLRHGSSPRYRKLGYL